MKQFILLPILILLFLINTKAQNNNYRDANTSLDISYSLISVLAGDIEIPLKQNLNLLNNKLYSIGIHQTFSDRIALKAAFDYGFYYAQGNVEPLPYYSNIYALSIRGEYNFLNFGKSTEQSLFLFLGAGVALSSGASNVGGEQKFKTTEPFEPFFVPMGIGYRAKISPKISLGVEADLHYFITDNLDGTPKPNSYPHDMLSSLIVNLKYSLSSSNSKNCRCEKF